MHEPSEALAAARDAYRRRDWAGARAGFLATRELGELSSDDLFALADAAWWLGLVDESVAVGEEAYRRYLHGQRPRQAARAAIGIAVNLLLRGDDVVGSGWMGRAQRLLRDEPECAEHGYLRYLLEVEAALGGPGLDAVMDSARQVQEIGRRHGDPNLVATGTLGEGRALVKQGRVAEGMALLDEAMVAVLSDDLSPEWAGNVYCHLMAACHELADVRRAVAWTEATTRWLETLPAAVLFTGICRVHRSQVFQITGAWEQAEREAARVCRDLADIHVASAAEGHYQVAELRRLRGDLAGAEEAYEEAHRRGRDPQPGLALVRLAQGRADAASASVRAALAAASGDPLARFRLRAAQVEIALAGGDVASARAASDELEEVAAAYPSSGFGATASHARGAVRLAEGRAAEALPVLREACRRWQELDAPYEAACVGTLLARAYEELDDPEAAARELGAAEAAFDRLGAAAATRQRTGPVRGRQLPGGLTAREVQVLALVAAGKTNREVASSLVISERTVARHLSNIFTKLQLPSRTAAAAFAFEHGLASPG